MRISDIKSYGKGLTHKEKQRIGYDPDLLAYRHKVKDIYPMEAVDWQALRTAGVVMPMAYHVPSNPVKPNVKQPNIITAYNLEKEKLGPGERLTPFTDQQVTPQFWQQYMDEVWPTLKPFKKDQIRQSARMKGIEFNEWMIMPQTIEPLGLIHKPGTGPNDRFDFKNKGNNRVNEAVQFTKPDTQYEWSEAQRYSYIKKLGFVGWSKLVNTGRQVNVSQFGGIRNIKNTTALNQPMAARELPKLEPDKVQRAQQSLKMGKFELPIVMKTPQGTLELVAGNTRFTMMVAKGMTPTVWYIDGSALKEWTAFEMACMEGGHPLPEDNSDEAWELLGQKDPAIKKYVTDLGLKNDLDSVNKVVPMIDKARETTITPSQIPQLKNLANKPADPQALKNILKIKGTPDAPQKFAQIMQARDRAERRSRNYDVADLINAINTNNYDPPVILKIGTQHFVVGGRTRLYAALALDKPIKVKVLEDAAGVGTITKQNTTKDVKPGDEYKNVKKLQLEYKEFLENFADKKVKGKSRPGRVKRAGASCKGSVSSLRAKAKKYGGERGKMYHWCANMKSGKK
jgi:hypothetical protein